MKFFKQRLALLLMPMLSSRAFLLSRSRWQCQGRRTLSNKLLIRSSTSWTTPTTTQLFSSTATKIKIPTCNNCWRPTVQDVERISWGKPAKKKGTGSRGVPHRLNQEERMQWDLAKRHGFLQVQGSAWRAQRRDAPLLNSWRSWCDAKKQACTVVHKQAAAEGDLVVVDLSTLRLPHEFASVAEVCLQQQEGGYIVSTGSTQEGQDTATETISTEESDDDNDDIAAQQEEDDWMSRSIYQLPPYHVVWASMGRTNAKALAKTLSKVLNTAEPNKKRSPSKKPFGVKPGKSRRHGGYGIG